ncbi:ankyrin repeat-containing domain protein [Mycena leptocephala]|nr:ankyrin repeat-containing domain protein [Mycena leptocephala]
MTGVASIKILQLCLANFRNSCLMHQTHKLRVLVSVKTASTKDKATLHEAESKAKNVNWQCIFTLRLISNLLAALEIVQQVGKIVESAPFIEPIGAILSEVVKVYKEVKDNHGKRDALLDKVASLALDIGKAILRLKDSGHAGSIVASSPIWKNTREARELIGAFDDRGGFIRIVKRGELGAGLDSLDRSLDFSEQDSGLEVKLEQWLNAPTQRRNTPAPAVSAKSLPVCGCSDIKFHSLARQPGKLLWIEGPSGAGKTILSSTVIEELFKHRGNNTAIAYFYFDFSDDSKQSMEIALRRLVLQLSRTEVPTWAELLDLLQKLLQELGCTYLILDALDECGNYDIIATLFRKSPLGQDYLLLPLEKHPAGCNACPIHVSETVAHPLLAETCIDYLLHFADPTHPLNVDTFPEYSLASYAAEYWGHHLVLCDESARLFASAMHLMTHGSRQYLALNHLHALRNPFRTSWWSNSVPTSPVSMCSRIGYFAGVKDLLQDHEVDTKQLADALWAASHHGHTEIVHLILANGADIKEEDQHLPQGNALSVACRKGHTEIVRLLIASGFKVNTSSALQVACQNGHTEIVRLLITNDANVEMPAGGPLAAACGRGHIDIVHLLLERGANVNPKVSGFIHMPLQAASSHGNIDIVHLLLDKGADINTMHKCTHDHYGLHTALTAASYYGHTDIVRLLLKSGARIEEQVLEAVCTGGNLDIVCLLFERQAEHNIDSLHEAFQAACDNGHMNIMHFLLGKFAAIVGGISLERASCRGYTEIIRFLLERGGDVNYDGSLAAALLGGHFDIVHLLLDNGADVNPDPDYDNPLEAASGKGHMEIVRILLEKGAKISGTALVFASSEGHIQIVRLLLENRADVNEVGQEWNILKTPLSAASWHGHIEIVRLLLENGAHVNQASIDWSALFAASKNGHIEIVRLLLENGADVNEASTDSGISALFVASENGHTEIVRLLLEHSADINAPNGEHGTALRAASEQWYMDVVRLLLENGAREEDRNVAT